MYQSITSTPSGLGRSDISSPSPFISAMVTPRDKIGNVRNSLPGLPSIFEQKLKTKGFENITKGEMKNCFTDLKLKEKPGFTDVMSSVNKILISKNYLKNNCNKKEMKKQYNIISEM